MDIKNIETFIKIAEGNSFTKVALETNYAQSTITTQIKQLENELGYPLFDRIGKTVSLTSYGMEFLKTANRIILEFNKAKSLKSEYENITGELRIGVIESLLFTEILKILPKFKKEYRNVDVKIKMGQTTELINMLKQNLLDLVYISSDINCDKDLLCQYKAKESLVFISSKNHPLSKCNNITPESLFSHDFAVTERTGICYNRLLRIAADNSCVLRDTIEVDSTIAITELVCQNLSLGFLPEYSVRGKVEAKELSILNTVIPKQFYYKQLLCHKSRFQSPFMLRIKDMISKI